MVRELTEYHGVSQGTEKMEKRICALCPKEHDWSVIYFAPSVNIAAHENCLLYSSGLVECVDRDPYDTDRNFDVKSVKKEIWRGQRLFVKDEKLKVKAVLEGKRFQQHLRAGSEDGLLGYKGKKNIGRKEIGYRGEQEAAVYGVKLNKYFSHVVACTSNPSIAETKAGGSLQIKRFSDSLKFCIFRLFCQQHAPKQEETTQSADCPSLKKKREREKDLSSDSPTQPTKKKHDKRHMTVEHLSHTGAVVKVPFLKKCKDAGLLTELFEEILEKVDLMYARLMDETTSDADYKEIETLLLGSGLFEDTLIKFQEVIKRKACEYEERQRQLKQQIEALGDLKEILCSFQENGDLDHSRSTSVSLEDPQLKCQECAEMQAGSEDSL
ncbi:PHD finger protein 11-like [Acomys russatus]|uniref:PHD finger protein 11-like n=1 Tax=Acomys russatus TaxID=60746 RepID=UPI0021E2DF73|nr:PHD finger protein 11-like [Acomys russatus]